MSTTHNSHNYASAAHGPAGHAGRRTAYSTHARSYNQQTGLFQSYRRAIVEALPLRRGQVVLDVGCGTGLCCDLLRDKVGSRGGVVGIEESPEMAAVAREQVARKGWRNVTVVQSPAEDARIGLAADAALFCAVHDILQSPAALRNVLNSLRPGAWVAAGGGKWTSPLMVGVNLLVSMLHAPYVRSFAGFGRPWSHLEPLIEDVQVREVALGGGYIMTGRAPAALAGPGSPGRRTGDRPCLCQVLRRVAAEFGSHTAPDEISAGRFAAWWPAAGRAGAIHLGRLAGCAGYAAACWMRNG